MNDARIEGFVAGSVAVTVTNLRAGVSLSMDTRGLPRVEGVFSVPQSARLRRLLAAAEKRCAQPTNGGE